jgi:hypothetical protein
MPGDKDPGEEMRKGNYSMTWGGRTIKNFKEVKIDHVLKEELSLPTLYLHFLTEEFRMPKDGDTLDQSLRSGNDASEIVIKLPAKYFEATFAAKCGDQKEQVETVLATLREVGEVFVNKATSGSGSAHPQVRFYSLKAARAKASVNLPKKLFGIPENADQYLFVNNHSSAVYYDDSVRQAFTDCIGELSVMDLPDAKNFAVFLKVFYEGGFGYNFKQPVGDRAFLPISVGVAAMSTVPAFDGQVGIGTGYPYQLPGTFLPFVETVPISIDAIRQMSERHGRYGLCFTRLVFVWEPEDFESGNLSLNFCSILPHGGFYYVPDSMTKHRELGGLVYAFGESKEDLTDAAVEQ